MTTKNNLPVLQQTPPKDLSYISFDDFTELADKLVSLHGRVEAACRSNNKDRVQVLREEVNLPATKKWVEKFKRLQTWYDREEQYDFDDDGTQRGVTRRVVSTQLSTLTVSIPDKPNNPVLFGEMMLNHVHAARPSACALESACRAVGQTIKKSLAPAHIIEALKKHEALWGERFEAAGDMGVTADEIVTYWDQCLAQRLDELDKEQQVRPITQHKPLPMKRKAPKVDFAGLIDIPHHEYDSGEEEE